MMSSWTWRGLVVLGLAAGPRLVPGTTRDRESQTELNHLRVARGHNLRVWTVKK